MKQPLNVEIGQEGNVKEKKKRRSCRHYTLLPTDDDVTGDCQLGHDLWMQNNCAICPHYESDLNAWKATDAEIRDAEQSFRARYLNGILESVMIDGEWEVLDQDEDDLERESYSRR